MTKHIFVKSYGCQMNVYDSNRIIDLFQPKGFQSEEVFTEGPRALHPYCFSDPTNATGEREQCK